MHRNRGGDGLRKIRTGMERNRGHITIQSPTEGEEESGKAEPLAPEQARSVLANTQLAIRGEYEAQPTVTQAGKLTDAVIDYYGERAYNVHHIVGMTAEKMRPIVEKYLEANNGARALLEYSGVNSLSELRLGGIRKEPTVRVLRSMNHLVGLLLSAHFIASAHNASGFR
ncbi:MAG: hypothetical protein LBD43_02885 [Holosporales bacterium]|nr:hypothetical protein [Holosporales bacterium]